MLRFITFSVVIVIALSAGWFSNQFYSQQDNQAQLSDVFQSIKNSITTLVNKAGVDIKTNDQSAASQQTALEHAEKHLDSTYVCPMHPQIVKGEPGSCPICGMDLVEVEAEASPSAMTASPSMNMAEEMASKLAPENAMQHAEKHLDPTYVCPMHPQIVKGEPGSCPICGMDLVEVETEVETKKTVSSGEKKILYWVAPMDANYRRDEAGKSPMGMDLVPVYAEESDSRSGSSSSSSKGQVVVKIDPGVVNNLGVQIESVAKGSLYRELDTVAYVDYDEDSLSHVHQLSDGWIEKLYVKAIGDKVKRGDLLYAVYSPELQNAQEDYLLSLKNKFKGVEKASRERLYSLGFTNSQIKRLKKTKKIERTLKTYAKHSGIVIKLSVRDGMYIKPQTEVMTLADLNNVWFIAEVYEKQSTWVKEGQDVKVTLEAYPGKEWYGEIDYIYPEMDKLSRTLKARIRMPNQHGLFKLNMYSRVKIYTQKIDEALYIPLQALIQSGDETRVIVQKEQGRFSPRIVIAGMESDNKIEIKSGLQEGEKVVVSGQFLIDSEASLKASLLRFKNKG